MTKKNILYIFSFNSLIKFTNMSKIASHALTKTTNKDLSESLRSQAGLMGTILKEAMICEDFRSADNDCVFGSFGSGSSWTQTTTFSFLFILFFTTQWRGEEG